MLLLASTDWGVGGGGGRVVGGHAGVALAGLQGQGQQAAGHVEDAAEHGADELPRLDLWVYRRGGGRVRHT